MAVAVDDKTNTKTKADPYQETNGGGGQQFNTPKAKL